MALPALSVPMTDSEEEEEEDEEQEDSEENSEDDKEETEEEKRKRLQKERYARGAQPFPIAAQTDVPQAVREMILFWARQARKHVQFRHEWMNAEDSEEEDDEEGEGSDEMETTLRPGQAALPHHQPPAPLQQPTQPMPAPPRQLPRPPPRSTTPQ